MKKNNYYVIGGQYETCCYGGAPTLTGAKRLATKTRNTGTTGRGGTSR